MVKFPVLLPPAFQRNGEGTIFTGTPSPSHNTSIDSSHVLSIRGIKGYPMCGPMCLLLGRGVPPSSPIGGGGGTNAMSGLDGGTPLDWMGVPPVRTGWGYHPTEQQSEYLLRGGRYASCVRVRGLSFLFLIVKSLASGKFSFEQKLTFPTEVQLNLPVGP